MAELVSGRCSKALAHLPALSHLDQKHAGSFTSAPTSQPTGSVHTAAISSMGHQLGCNGDREFTNSVYTPPDGTAFVCLWE